ncbi:MAG TPA: hypothetical protein VMT24_11020 [Aggregatilineaceae bacterium]|nr:hypothetical protein [Aggregatilineaceae bacterium]
MQTLTPRFLAVIGSLFALCITVVAGTHAFARRDPPPRMAALLPDPTCPKPCWQGFHPSQIDPFALQAWFNDPPHGWQARYYHIRGAPPGYDENWEVSLPQGGTFDVSIVRWRDVDLIRLYAPGLTVGDALAALGKPGFISLSLKPIRSGTTGIEIDLVFPAYDLVVETLLSDDAGYLGADTPVRGLVYEPISSDSIPVTLAWSGFGPVQRYFGGTSAP